MGPRVDALEGDLPARPHILMALTVGLGACREAPPEVAAPDLGAAPRVHLAGCADVRPGPVCRRPQGPITAWIAAAPDAVVDGEALGAVAAGAGTRLTLPSAGATTIRVRGLAPLTVRIEAAAEGPGRAEHAAGRQANREGRPDEAVRLLTVAAERQAAAGDASGAALSATILAFVYRERGQLDRARDALTRWQPPPEDGAGRGTHAFYFGLLAYAGADPRGALRAFDEAARWTARLGLRLDWAIRQQRALTFTDLGRVDEAIAALETFADEVTDLSACRRADLLTNLGWALLASSRAAEPETGAVLAEAATRYGECPEATASKRANARVNHGLWALHTGHRSLAEAARSVPTEVDPEVRAWARYLDARLRPTPRAQAAALDTLAGLSADAGFAQLRWRALVDAGVAFAEAGEPRAAIARYRAAEAVVAAGAFDIPADAGRLAYAADRNESASRLVAALVATGQQVEAMDAARRARRRVLTTLPSSLAVEQLDEAGRRAWESAWSAWRRARAELARSAADDWTLSEGALAAAQARRAQERRQVQGLLDAALARLAHRGAADDATLRPPSAGELILTWIRTPEGAWRVLAQDLAGVETALVQPGDWTAPVRARIAAARSVRVLAVGPTIGATLRLGRPAAFALDLPPRPARPPARTAALVADPTGDLPGARAEAERVRPGLRAAVAAPSTLFGADARAEAIIRALGTVDHLHYAGHGRYAGFEGWESALPVRDGALELGDLLALPRVPAVVVLSGCETGRAEGDAAIGVGLAHALLVRGADVVIAPVRPVDDARAALFGVALYAARARRAPWPEALAAGLEASGADSYRLFVP